MKLSSTKIIWKDSGEIHLGEFLNPTLEKVRQVANIFQEPILIILNPANA